MRAICLLFILSAMMGAEAFAACTGSGTAYSCTAGSTVANINSAVSSSDDGATITLADGSYTFAGNISWDDTKSTTIICATVRGCTLNIGTNNVMYHDDVSAMTSAAAMKTWRLSGFIWSGACTSPCIWVYPRDAVGIQYFQLVLDNNTFANQANAADGDFMIIGETTPRPMKVRGVIHNNIFNYTTQTRLQVLGTGDPDDHAGSLLGSEADCLFFEDNQVNFTSPSNSGLGAWDGSFTSCLVVRFNTFTNARTLQHGTTHGWGMTNFEVYGNKYVRNTNSDGLGDCYRSIHDQGSGTAMFWGNAFDCNSTIATGAIELLHYRSATPAEAGYDDPPGQCDGTYADDGNTSPDATYHGYPCKMQPGRAPAGGSPTYGTLSPIGAFLNIDLDNSNAMVPLDTDCPWISSPVYCSTHIVNDREYYNAVSATAQTSASSPFDGTTGIGHGTLANRPTTCTHNTSPDGDNGGGVMYWATDQGSWNTSSTNPEGVQQNGADGVLYRCSATNTWSVYYTPVEYPHPAREADQPADPNVPDSASKGLGTNRGGLFTRFMFFVALLLFAGGLFYAGRNLRGPRNGRLVHRVQGH